MSTRIIAIPVNAGKEPLIFDTIWQAGKFFWPSITNLAMLTKKVKDQIESGEPVKEHAMYKDRKESHEVTRVFLDYYIEPNNVTVIKEV